MTIQTVQLQTYDYGASLTSATLRNVANDTLVATADTVNEVTADGGLYAAVFDETSVIAAGTYRFRAVVGGQPINRYVTLAGTDAEVVQARIDKAAELDSSALDPVLEAIDNYVSSVVAGAQLAVGTIVGFPATLAIGDSYTDDCNSAIHVFIRDANDDPVTSVGDHEFTDLDFAPECTITLSGNTGKVKATVTYVDPGASESYLKIQIPPKESRRATPGVATVQVVLKWSDSGAQKTLSSQAVTWTNQL